MAVALASVAVAAFGGPDAVPCAGMVYLLIFPLQTINGQAMKACRRKQGVTAASTVEVEEGGENPNSGEP